MLNEAVTKTAQFTDIVRMLLDAGAGLGGADSLGNTPLHNAVLYHPSTQQVADIGIYLVSGVVTFKVY